MYFLALTNPNHPSPSHHDHHLVFLLVRSRSCLRASASFSPSKVRCQLRAFSHNHWILANPPFPAFVVFSIIERPHTTPILHPCLLPHLSEPSSRRSASFPTSLHPPTQAPCPINPQTPPRSDHRIIGLLWTMVHAI